MIALLIRDLRLAFRAGGGFGLGVVFFLIVVILVPFGVGTDTTVLARIGPGVLWIGALLACLLSLDRIFALDFEDGTLELLATSPVPLEGAIGVKALVHWLTTGVPLIVVSPLYAIMLNLSPSQTIWVAIPLLVGTPALSFLGAFGAAITVGVRRGGLLMSLLVLPLYVPTLIFGAEVARRGMNNQPFDTPLLFLAGLTAGCIALIPFAAAAALRANLRSM